MYPRQFPGTTVDAYFTKAETDFSLPGNGLSLMLDWDRAFGIPKLGPTISELVLEVPVQNS